MTQNGSDIHGSGIVRFLFDTATCSTAKHKDEVCYENVADPVSFLAFAPNLLRHDNNDHELALHLRHRGDSLRRHPQGYVSTLLLVKLVLIYASRLR